MWYSDDVRITLPILGRGRIREKKQDYLTTEAQMKRITISIPPEDLEKIEQLAQQKGLILSECLRMLIRIGFTVEEAAAEKNPGERPPFLSVEEQLLLWKTQLDWQQETRLLVRHLVDTLTQAPLKDRDALLEDAQQKACAVVQNLLLPIQPLKNPIR